MKLKGYKIAILACDGFEETEMTQPRKALQKEKALTHLISPQATKIKSWLDNKWHKEFKVDVKLEKAKPENYDALLLPGGVINPDKLRMNKKAIKFIDHFFRKNKPIAAICHGPLSLVETKRLLNRTLTSYPSIKTDLGNAGAKWKNKKVVVDQHLITSRKPSDIPAFNKALIKLCTALNEAKPKKTLRAKKIAKKPFIR